MREFGFFSELPHGDPDGESIHDYIRDSAGEYDLQVASYLQSGATLGATAGLTQDVLDPQGGTSGPLAIQTDGEWIWPADLPFYVRTYHVEVPAGLVERAASFNWRAPEMTRDQLIEIEKVMFPF
jgi:hypothetical protein